MFGPPFFLVIFQILTTEYFDCLGQLFSTILKFLKLITFEVFLLTTSCLQIGKCFFYLVKAEQVKRDIATIITSTMHFDSVGQEQFFKAFHRRPLISCRNVACCNVTHVWPAKLWSFWIIITVFVRHLLRTTCFRTVKKSNLQSKLLTTNTTTVVKFGSALEVHYILRRKRSQVWFRYFSQ